MADVYNMLSDDTLRKIADGANPYDSMTDEELRQVAAYENQIGRSAFYEQNEGSSINETSDDYWGTQDTSLSEEVQPTEIGRVQTLITPEEAKQLGSMSGTEISALQTQANGGPIAYEADGSVLNWFKNLWNAVAHNSSGKLTEKSTSRHNQAILRGMVKKDGRDVSLTELDDDELDYLVDSAGWNGWKGWLGSFVGNRSDDGIMQQWDRTTGAKIADPVQRKAARVKHAQDIARQIIEQQEAEKMAAQTELDNRPRDWGAGMSSGFINNASYMLPYFTPHIGALLAGGIEGGDRTQELLNDAYFVDDDGVIRVAAERDATIDAILKGAARGVIAPLIEKVGGEIGSAAVGAIAKNTIGKIPLFKNIGGKVVETAAGKAISKWMKSMSRLGKYTGIQSLPVEALEEFEDQVIDAGLGIGLRASEKGDSTFWSRAGGAAKEFFKPENLTELAESMVLLQVLGGGAAFLHDRKMVKYIDNLIAKEAGIDPDEIKDYTLDEKLEAYNAFVNSLSEEEIAKKFNKGADAIIKLTKAIEEGSVFVDDFEKSAMDSIGTPSVDTETVIEPRRYQQEDILTAKDIAEQGELLPFESAASVTPGTVVVLPDGQTKLRRNKRGVAKWEILGASRNSIALDNSAADRLLANGFRIFNKNNKGGATPTAQVKTTPEEQAQPQVQPQPQTQGGIEDETITNEEQEKPKQEEQSVAGAGEVEGQVGETKTPAEVGGEVSEEGVNYGEKLSEADTQNSSKTVAVVNDGGETTQKLTEQAVEAPTDASAKTDTNTPLATESATEGKLEGSMGAQKGKGRWDYLEESERPRSIDLRKAKQSFIDKAWNNAGVVKKEDIEKQLDENKAILEGVRQRKLGTRRRLRAEIEILESFLGNPNSEEFGGVQLSNEPATPPKTPEAPKLRTQAEADKAKKAEKVETVNTSIGSQMRDDEMPPVASVTKDEVKKPEAPSDEVLPLVEMPQDASIDIDETGEGEATDKGIDKNNLNNYNNPQEGIKNEQQTEEPIKGAADEFRGLQEVSRTISPERRRLFADGSVSLDVGERDRIAGVLQRRVERERGNDRGSTWVLRNPKTNEDVKVDKVSGKTFYECFSVCHPFLVRGDQVELHDPTYYDKGFGIISSDGLAGFFITESGDAISGYSLQDSSGRGRGFFKTIAPIMKQYAKTTDCFYTSKQNLPEFYQHIFGFQTAAILDFNYDIIASDKGTEYADWFVNTYGEAPVYFMVNVPHKIEARHFNKDEYDEAVAYQKKCLTDKPETNKLKTADGVDKVAAKKPGTKKKLGRHKLSESEKLERSIQRNALAAKAIYDFVKPNYPKGGLPVDAFRYSKDKNPKGLSLGMMTEIVDFDDSAKDYLIEAGLTGEQADELIEVVRKAQLEQKMRASNMNDKEEGVDYSQGASIALENFEKHPDDLKLFAKAYRRVIAAHEAAQRRENKEGVDYWGKKLVELNKRYESLEPHEQGKVTLEISKLESVIDTADKKKENVSINAGSFEGIGTEGEEPNLTRDEQGRKEEMDAQVAAETNDTPTSQGQGGLRENVGNSNSKDEPLGYYRIETKGGVKSVVLRTILNEEIKRVPIEVFEKVAKEDENAKELLERLKKGETIYKRHSVSSGIETPEERNVRFANDKGYQAWLKKQKANDAEPLRQRYEKQQGESAWTLAKNFLKGVKAKFVDRDYNPETDGGEGNRNSIIGTRGLHILEKDSIVKKAQKMLDNGMDRLEVWKKTGVYRGVDGRYRYEIPFGYDEAWYLLQAAETVIANKNNDSSKGSVTLGEAFDFLKQVVEANPKEIKERTFKAIEELFIAYPSMRNVTLNTFARLPKGTDGEYNIRQKSISINESAQSYNGAEVLIHELQHAIQAREHFVGGTSTTVSSDYRTRAGEVEARLAAYRSQLSSKERKATPPWEQYDIAEKDQTFAPWEKFEIGINGDERLLRNPDTGRVVGTWNRKTNELTLYRGANAKTLVHELGGHAAYQLAEQQAKAGDDTLLRKMNESIDYVLNSPVFEDFVADVRSRYPDAGIEEFRDEIFAALMERNSPAMEAAIKTLQGKAWYNRIWQAIKDAFKSMLTSMGYNKADVRGIDKMKPEEFVSWLDRTMAEGKNLGALEMGKEDGTRNAFINPMTLPNLYLEGSERQFKEFERIAKRVDKFEEMESMGIDRDTIWHETGLWRGKDGEIRTEVPDIKVSDGFLKYMQLNVNVEPTKQLKAVDGENGADNEWLFRLYPKFRTMPITITNIGDGTLGIYSGVEEGILLDRSLLSDPEMFRAVLAHELQHAIQLEEGFSTGTNLENMGGYDNYKRTTGEVEARNVAARLALTPEGREVVPPWDTEDVDEESQIISYSNNGLAELRQRTPRNHPIISNIMERLKFGKNYDPKKAHHIAYSSNEIALFHDKGDGEYDIIHWIPNTPENYEQLLALAKFYNSEEGTSSIDADIQEVRRSRGIGNLDRGNNFKVGRTYGGHGNLAISNKRDETRGITQEGERDSGELKPNLLTNIAPQGVGTSDHFLDDTRSTKEKMEERFIDALAPVRSAQNEIDRLVRARGEGGVEEMVNPDGSTDWRNSTDFIAAKDKENGHLERKLRELKQKYVDPAMESLARAILPDQDKDSLVTDFNLYLQCRHAAARNKKIAQDRGEPYTPDYHKGMGMVDVNGVHKGLSENLANEILAKFRRKYGAKMKFFESAAQNVYDMLEADLNNRYESGLLSKEDRDHYMARRTGAMDWGTYVPLKTDLLKTEGDAYREFNSSLKRNEFMKARGRGDNDIADSPFAAAVLQAEQGIRRSSRNVLANVEANLAAKMNGGYVANGDTDFSVTMRKDNSNPNSDPVYAQIVEGQTFPNSGTDFRFVFPDGDSFSAASGARLVQNRSDIHLFKRDGKLYAIRYNRGSNNRGIDVAKAFSGENMGYWGKGMDWLPKVANWLSSMRTQYSPEFMVSNMLSDNLDAFQALVGRYGIVDGTKAFAKAVKYQWKNKSDLAHYLKTGEARGKVKDAINAGLLTKGGVRSEGIDAETKRIKGELDKFLLQQKKWGSMGSAERVKAFGRNLADAISAMNEFAEYSTRIGIASALEEYGIPRKDAVKFARDATVNFNRKGTMMPYINSLYIFANASVQGAMRSLGAFKDDFSAPNVKSGLGSNRKMKGELLGALVLVGVAKAFIDNMLGDDDEREAAGGRNASNQTEYDRKHNVGIPIGGGRQVVPLRFRGPYAAIPYLAQTFTRLAMGEITPTRAAEIVAGELGDQVTELVGGNGMLNDKGELDESLVLQSIAPTLVDPFVQGMTGKDYKGDDRLRKKFDDTLPDSSNARRNTPWPYVKMAKVINWLTGGNENRIGRADFAPENIQLMVEFLGGAPLRDVNNIVSTVQNVSQLADGGTPEKLISQMPFVRRVVREYPESTGRYYDAVEMYERDKAEYKKATRLEDRRNLKKNKPYLSSSQNYIDKMIEQVKELNHLANGEVQRHKKWVKPKIERTEAQKEVYRQRKLKLQAKVLKALDK